MASLYSFSGRLLMWACLKRERLRWGSPTATAPFAFFGFAPNKKSPLGGLCLVYCVLVIPAKPPKLGRFLAGHLVIKRRQKIIGNFAKIMILALATFFQNIIWPSNFT